MKVYEKRYKMKYKIRKWELSDAKGLAMALSNRKIQDNLRDGLPYPYTEQDGADYIILLPAGYLKKQDSFLIENRCVTLFWLCSDGNFTLCIICKCFTRKFQRA